MSAQKPTMFEHEHAAPAAGPKSFVIFLALAGLTAMALLVGFTDLGPWKIVASLTISVTQAIVLTVFFMDLKNSDTQTWLIAAASIFWTGLMFLFILTDFFTRHWYAL
ncbi:MAG: cytochrome C oxidase subunit IV family protein [Gemmataceae bacterium]